MSLNRNRYRNGEERIVGIIGDEDTITGFLLAGVGDSNSVNVGAASGAFGGSGGGGSGDAASGGGSGGHAGRGPAPNYYVVAPSTPLPDIEEAFTSMLRRADIGIILICQHIANDIRHVINDHREPLPCVLEIPSKGLPYDSDKDEVLAKISRSLGIK